MLRLGEVRTQSNPYMNPYNHSRPQNVSRIEGSFIEENPGFTTSVFRTGHLLRPTQQSEQEAELTSITTELLDCMCVWKLLWVDDFRTSVQFVHKHLILQSPIPFQDSIYLIIQLYLDTIQTLIVGLQQELRSIASLRYSFIYPITDTTNEYKCVLQLLWQTSGQRELYLGRDDWKQLCERYVRNVGMTCKWMVDIHPDFYKDKFIVYK